MNVTTPHRGLHCLYGADGEPDDEEADGPGVISPIEADGFLRWLPTYRRQPSEDRRKLFGSGDLWYARCFR